MTCCNNQTEAASNYWRTRRAVSAFGLVAVLTGMLIWLLSRSAGTKTATETPLPAAHPVFGMIHETRAKDVMDMPEIRGPTGLLPSTPVYLLVGAGLMEWSAADVRPRKQSGYLYFWDPISASNDSNVWTFAPCKQSRLADLTEKDLEAVFCAASELEKGRATFGTNWVNVRQGANAILVREGEVILARHSRRPSRIYALEITKQQRGNLRARYLEAER